MDQNEFDRCCAAFGVESGITIEVLKRVYLKKNFALIRSGTPEEREQLRDTYDRLVAHLEAQPPVLRVTSLAAPPGEQGKSGSPARRPVPAGQPLTFDPDKEERGLLSFDSWGVNLLALPLVGVIAWLINRSPFGFFLQGFHIWVHEFGHATVAWLVGKQALPLPLGWTSVSGEKSTFVYFGVLFLLGVLLVAGWKERKIWPILIALAIAPLQFYMTWRMSASRADMWLSFGGVGGEFYLSAVLMTLFYFQFPEKFKWGFCRYFFLFLGASSFLNSYLFWHQIKRGNESIPWGSMIHGEEDGGGDMNILRDVYHWSNHDIIGTYSHIGNVCLVGLLIVYLVFALRMDRIANRRLIALWPG